MPSDLKISAKVRTILENHEQKDILFGSANFSNLTSTESVDKVSYLTVKNELKCIQIEQECSKRLIVELERTINNQELIISLLKNDRNSDVNKCHNTVATSSTNSSNTEKNNRPANNATRNTDIKKNSK